LIELNKNEGEEKKAVAVDISSPTEPAQNKPLEILPIERY
jgi:hypothetical protein